MAYAEPNLGVASHRSVHTARSVAVKSQTFTFRSAPREARCLPSGWNATLTTEFGVCAGKVWIGVPVLLFQIVMVPSPPADASRSPSGLNTTPLASVLTEMTSGSTLQSRIRQYHSHSRRSSGQSLSARRAAARLSINSSRWATVIRWKYTSRRSRSTDSFNSLLAFHTRTVLTASAPTPTSAARARTDTVTSARLLRRASLRKRYQAEGGQA